MNNKIKVDECWHCGCDLYEKKYYDLNVIYHHKDGSDTVFDEVMDRVCHTCAEGWNIKENCCNEYTGLGIWCCLIKDGIVVRKICVHNIVEMYGKDFLVDNLLRL